MSNLQWLSRFLKSTTLLAQRFASVGHPSLSSGHASNSHDMDALRCTKNPPGQTKASLEQSVGAVGSEVEELSSESLEVSPSEGDKEEEGLEEELVEPLGHAENWQRLLGSRCTMSPLSHSNSSGSQLSSCVAEQEV